MRKFKADEISLLSCFELPTWAIKAIANGEDWRSARKNNRTTPPIFINIGSMAKKYNRRIDDKNTENRKNVEKSQRENRIKRYIDTSNDITYDVDHTRLYRNQVTFLKLMGND